MVRKGRLIILAGILGLGLLGFLFPNPQPHFWWQAVPVFDIIFGFVGCVIIIIVSKWIGHRWLMKSEDYYD